MGYVKTLNHFVGPSSNLLVIKERTSFKKILAKVSRKSKDLVFVVGPKPSQMAAMVLVRLSGKNFYWIQGFSNPPVPSFLARLLINQADLVLVKSRKVAANLRSQGVEKPRMKLALI